MESSGESPEDIESSMRASLQKYKKESFFSQPQYEKHIKDFFSEFELKERLGEVSIPDPHWL